MSEAMDKIREYYPSAEVIGLYFRDSRYGYGVRLEPDDTVTAGLGTTKREAAFKAMLQLEEGGSIPTDGA